MTEAPGGTQTTPTERTERTARVPRTERAPRATIAIAGSLALAVLLVPTARATVDDGTADRVGIDEFTPLPPFDLQDVPADVAELRDELIGPAWRDPDNVTMSWVGVSSFIASIGGHVFLFDAWEIIGATTDYLPLGREELAAIEPEAIMIGHAHFDHAGDLGYVAGLAGSVVVGSEEHCVVAEQGAVREGVGTDFTCAITGTATTPAAGDLLELQLWEDVEPVTIMRHIHSAATPPGEDNAPDPQLPIFDPQPYLDHLADDPEELARFLAQQEESEEGGAWLYHLRDGDFTLLWGNSAGPIFQDAAIRDALDAYPGCVDVMSNAILGFDQPVSGFQDPRLYVEHAHPKVFLPQHGDAWAPVISAGQEQYVEPVTAELETLENPPEVDFLLDPEDYLDTRVYDVTAERWVEPMAGSSCVASASVDRDASAAPDDEDDSGSLAATGGGLGALAVALLALGAILVWRRRR